MAYEIDYYFWIFLPKSKEKTIYSWTNYFLLNKKLSLYRNIIDMDRLIIKYLSKIFLPWSKTIEPFVIRLFHIKQNNHQKPMWHVLLGRKKNIPIIKKAKVLFYIFWNGIKRATELSKSEEDRCFYSLSVYTICSVSSLF